MPNRKRDVGWFLLPRSGVPFYGTVPEGVEAISEKDTLRLAEQRDGDSDAR